MTLNIESAPPIPESPSLPHENRAVPLVEQKELCPNCQSLSRVGELICSTCGFILSTNGKTQKLDESLQEGLERTRRVGEAITNNMRPISLIINGIPIVVPEKSVVVIGRSGHNANDPQPDIDLTHFQAHQRGISRQHVELIRNRDMVYIKDLNSVNGTYLNGFRLIANQQRLLRNGDELMLARLIMTVRF